MAGKQTGWQVWKDFVYPGKVVVPGPKGKSFTYNFTTRDINQLIKTGNNQLKAGWNVPSCWEHQDEAAPVRLRLSQGESDSDDDKGERDMEFAKSIFGFLKRFARTPDGRGKVLLAGHDPADYAQLEKIRFVSPEIQWDWTDTDGRTWHGPSVTHLAATPRPVQRHQHPVGTNPDKPHPQLANAGSLEKLVRLSLTASGCVGRKLRLSLEHYPAHAGSSAMPDDDKKKKDDKPKVPGMPEEKESAWERIAAALEKCGVKIGDGANIKDADHLADLIEVACLNSEHAEKEYEDDFPPEEEDEENPPEGDMNEPPEGATEPPPPPVQMSLEAKQQIEASNGKLLAMHRKDLVRRAERLGTRGHVPPTVANDLTAQAKKIRLSLTANAELVSNELITTISAYEKMPANSAWSKDGRQPAPTGGGKGKDGKNGKGKKSARLSIPANTTPVEPPYRENGEEDTDAVVEAYEQNVGRKGYSGDADGD